MEEKPAPAELQELARAVELLEEMLEAGPRKWNDFRVSTVEEVVQLGDVLDKLANATIAGSHDDAVEDAQTHIAEQWTRVRGSPYSGMYANQCGARVGTGFCKGSLKRGEATDAGFNLQLCDKHFEDHALWRWLTCKMHALLLGSEHVALEQRLDEGECGICLKPLVKEGETGVDINEVVSCMVCFLTVHAACVDRQRPDGADSSAMEDEALIHALCSGCLTERWQEARVLMAAVVSQSPAVFEVFDSHSTCAVMQPKNKAYLEIAKENAKSVAIVHPKVVAVASPLSAARTRARTGARVDPAAAAVATAAAAAAVVPINEIAESSTSGQIVDPRKSRDELEAGMLQRLAKGKAIAVAAGAAEAAPAPAGAAASAAARAAGAAQTASSASASAEAKAAAAQRARIEKNMQQLMERMDELTVKEGKKTAAARFMSNPGNRASVPVCIDGSVDGLPAGSQEAPMCAKFWRGVDYLGMRSSTKPEKSRMMRLIGAERVDKHNPLRDLTEGQRDRHQFMLMGEDSQEIQLTASSSKLGTPLEPTLRHYWRALTKELKEIGDCEREVFDATHEEYDFFQYLVLAALARIAFLEETTSYLTHTVELDWGAAWRYLCIWADAHFYMIATENMVALDVQLVQALEQPNSRILVSAIAREKYCPLSMEKARAVSQLSKPGGGAIKTGATPQAVLPSQGATAKEKWAGGGTPSCPLCDGPHSYGAKRGYNHPLHIPITKECPKVMTDGKKCGKKHAFAGPASENDKECRLPTPAGGNRR
jgi:hypothetical protein